MPLSGRVAERNGNRPDYDAKQRNFLLSGGTRETRFYINDPVTVLTQWPQGKTCSLSLKPVGNCTQGGFPVYVLNATTVKHIRAAVNFARNEGVRLVIKYGSLWTWHLCVLCYGEIALRRLLTVPGVG